MNISGWGEIPSFRDALFARTRNPEVPQNLWIPGSRLGPRFARTETSPRNDERRYRGMGRRGRCMRTGGGGVGGPNRRSKNDGPERP
jgi:hypothetical protein